MRLHTSQTAISHLAIVATPFDAVTAFQNRPDDVLAVIICESKVMRVDFVIHHAGISVDFRQQRDNARPGCVGVFPR